MTASNTPMDLHLNTRIIDEDTTYVLATAKGSALGLFRNLVRQGKPFRCVPLNDGNYCEFFIEEENEQKGWFPE